MGDQPLVSVPAASPDTAAEPVMAAESPSATTGPSWGDRIAARVAARTSQVVLGLDPDPARLWPGALELAERDESRFAGPPARGARAARAVSAHCALAIEATAEHCVAVKPQLACFERLGAPGWAALQEVVDRAHEHDLLVIADGKRGDIDISALAYAQAFFGETPTAYGPVPGLGADALTVNPLLGADALAPLLICARERACGVFVLVRTSNPGAEDVQERRLAGDGTVSERIAQMVAELGAPGVGRSGLSDVGAVVGATAPDRLEGLRERMPHAVFLMPGVGVQGGQVQDLVAAFAPGPGGGLVSASRGIVNAHEHSGGAPAAAAADAARRLRELAWDLAA
jgi:orotidine-5'-phosphate decarboxylase